MKLALWEVAFKGSLQLFVKTNKQNNRQGWNQYLNLHELHNGVDIIAEFSWVGLFVPVQVDCSLGSLSSYL